MLILVASGGELSLALMPISLQASSQTSSTIRSTTHHTQLQCCTVAIGPRHKERKLASTWMLVCVQQPTDKLHLENHG